MLRFSLAHMDAGSRSFKSIFVFFKNWENDFKGTSSLSKRKVAWEDFDKSKKEKSVFINLEHFQVAIRINPWDLCVCIETNNVENISNNIEQSEYDKNVCKYFEALWFSSHNFLIHRQTSSWNSICVGLWNSDWWISLWSLRSLRWLCFWLGRWSKDWIGKWSCLTCVNLTN